MKHAKMNNKLLRLVALLLVSLMLLFAVACANPTEDDGGETTKNASGTQGGTVADGETTFESSGLPDNLNYGNSVSILYWSDVEEPEFEVKEISLNHTENAIYWRNQNTITKLGLDPDEGLVWTGIPGNHGNRTAFAEHVGNSYNAGTRDYDIIASYSRSTAICAVSGYLADLMAIEDSYIDLSRQWWTPSIIKTVTIDDSIYFLSGDISTNTIHMMYSIFCNTEMIKELNLDDPVAMTIDKTWTLDKFMSLCEGVFSERNNDDKPSVGDRFGFVTTSLHTDAFYHGSGLYFIETDIDDVLVISDDFSSVKCSNLVTKLRDFYATVDVRGTGSPETEFVAENALFTQNRIKFAQNYLSKVDFKYACLPTPMYDEKQDGYRTCVGNPVTLWAMMKDVTDDEDFAIECTAVLESLAYEGYCNTTPQIFETNLKVKYSDQDNIQTVQCFDLIREGVVYDLGRIFSDTDMGTYMNDLFSRTVVGADDWSSVLAANLFLLEGNLEEIVDKFDEHKYK